MTEPRPWRADGALLAVALIWGHNVPIMKYGLSELNVYAFNALRLAFSALLLGALAWREARGRPTAPLDRATWRRVLAVAALGSLIYQLLFMTGVDLTTAGNVGLIIASGPLWTALIARFLGVEFAGARAWFGIAIAFAGTIWVTLEGGRVDFAESTIWGNVLVVIAAICWATSTVLSKPLVAAISPTRLAWLSTATMLPAHVAIGIPFVGDPTTIALPVWGSIAYAGLLSTGLAYALWNYGVQQVGPSHTSVYTNLVPVITLISSLWILGESVTASQLGGGTLVLVGLIAMRSRRGAAQSRTKNR